ncbi:uncharacterized protein [Scyliorhinus torazame]|uniref:uncharacterized protein n=1 Tax=Scyliorhinus torazame TaxID=75743 RepID=UPI003B5AF881
METPRAGGKVGVFSLRRSVKSSSSSENEGEEIRTPTNKSLRAPLQDVLPRCSAQRDLTNPINKKRSEAVQGSHLTPLMCRLHLQDEGRDPFQKMLVKKDCVRVPQAMSLSSLVTRTAGPGLNNALPKFTLTEDDDSVLVCVRDEAIRCPLQKGEPITIEAQEDRKLSLGDTALASGLTRHRSSTLVETVTKQTATGPGPKMVVGSPLPANLEVAGQPDVFQSNCPGVVTENSWDIIPEMEINEGSTKMWLESQISVDGLSTSLGSGSVGIDQGNLPGIEVRKTWQLEGGLHTGNGKQEDEKRVEVGVLASGQVEAGVPRPGLVEAGVQRSGQVAAGSGQVAAGSGQVEVG